jgi:thiosulfate/3-mercaptopyruvate sulfurtransferase
VSYEASPGDDSVVARIAEARAALDDPETVFVDTRTPAEYLGLRPTARHDGHIPGAINVDWSNTFRLEGGIAVLDETDRLVSLYREAGVGPEQKVIVYCASGMRASHSFAVLRSLGYPRVTMYVPGWNEWGNRDDTPVETP